jgi:hypothetical protein
MTEGSAMFTSTCSLVERAVHLGARRPTTRVVTNPERWADWRAAADQLVVASSIIDLTQAEMDDLISACDRAAGLTPERIGEAIDTVASFIALIAAPIAAVCIL